jgi:chemotaxis protein MotB
VLFDLNDPFNPVNRRISIIVMSKKAEDSLSKEGDQIKQIKANTVVDSRAPLSAGAS